MNIYSQLANYFYGIVGPANTKDEREVLMRQFAKSDAVKNKAPEWFDPEKDTVWHTDGHFNFLSESGNKHRCPIT